MLCGSKVAGREEINESYSTKMETEMKFKIENSLNAKINFIAEIDCAEDVPRAQKLRLAVEWAIENNICLQRAYLQGADLRNMDLSQIEFERANLEGAKLTGANLSNAVLYYVNLQGADLSNAVLSWACLESADLRGANLQNAKLKWSKMKNINLEFANLQGADLKGADLRGANLEGANLEGMLPERKAELMREAEKSAEDAVAKISNGD